MSSFTLDFTRHPQLRFRIDSFSVPEAARVDFEAAMQRNLAFIETLPGFLGHLVFKKASGPSNFNIVTIAAWESPQAIEKAIPAVRQYYEEIGFNPAEATARWGVAAEIGEYELPPELQGQSAA
jgi:Antibiotic biosynthesis monooxygenase